MRNLRLWALVALTFVSFAPLVAMLTGSGVASALGCSIDEGSTHPCLLAGVDLGDALYNLFVCGWLVLLTWPGMIAATVLWLVVLVRALKRRNSVATPS